MLAPGATIDKELLKRNCFYTFEAELRWPLEAARLGAEIPLFAGLGAFGGDGCHEPSSDILRTSRGLSKINSSTSNRADPSNGSQVGRRVKARLGSVRGCPYRGGQDDAEVAHLGDTLEIKTIVCLANSHASAPADCVAGIELVDETGAGRVRPVSDRPSGEVAEREREYQDGSDPQILDVVSIPLIRP